MRFPLPRLFGALALILVSLAAVLPAPALAATTCTSTFAGVTIRGNLTVPDGGDCWLTGSTVTGNVTLGANATFEISGTTIQGNLRGDRAYTVILGSGTVVYGKVTISETSRDVSIESIQVNGNLTLTGNSPESTLTVANSTIGGNLTVSGNTSSRSANIQDNSVGGNLACDGNVFPPTGGGNAVSGRQRGQCAGL
jgi:hypothetical protein